MRRSTTRSVLTTKRDQIIMSRHRRSRLIRATVNQSRISRIRMLRKVKRVKRYEEIDNRFTDRMPCPDICAGTEKNIPAPAGSNSGKPGPKGYDASDRSTDYR